MPSAHPGCHRVGVRRRRRLWVLEGAHMVGRPPFHGCRGARQLCSLRLCTCRPGDAAWCPEHHRQVWVWCQGQTHFGSTSGVWAAGCQCVVGAAPANSSSTSSSSTECTRLQIGRRVTVPLYGSLWRRPVWLCPVQCCAGPHLSEGAAQHLWHPGLCPVYHRVNNNRPACTSRAAH